MTSYSVISVFMTNGSLIGKKITLSRISDDTTILQFAQRFIPQLGFSFLVGSLCTEFFGKSDFIFKNGVCSISSPNQGKGIVEGTFGGSTQVTCVTKISNHPINLRIRDFDGVTHSVTAGISWSVVELGKCLLEKRLFIPGDYLNVRKEFIGEDHLNVRKYADYDDDYHDDGNDILFEDEHNLWECSIDDHSQIAIVSPKREEERREKEEKKREKEREKKKPEKGIFSFLCGARASVNAYPMEHACSSPMEHADLAYDLAPLPQVHHFAPLPRVHHFSNTIYNRMEFVDVTSDKMEKLKVSQTAPEWRIFCKGLTMEGVCKNWKCVANSKNVLSIHGYATFRLGKMCFRKIELIRPMFYKCVVVYNGMKSNKSRISTAPRVFEELQTYKVEEAGRCEYEFLIMQVSKPDHLFTDPRLGTEVVLPETCHICHQTLQKNAAEFLGLCGHMFHKNCVEN